jgi:hypothetical protein
VPHDRLFTVHTPSNPPKPPTTDLTSGVSAAPRRTATARHGDGRRRTAARRTAARRHGPRRAAARSSPKARPRPGTGARDRLFPVHTPSNHPSPHNRPSEVQEPAQGNLVSGPAARRMAARRLPGMAYGTTAAPRPASGRRPGGRRPRRGSRTWGACGTWGLPQTAPSRQEGRREPHRRTAALRLPHGARHHRSAWRHSSVRRRQVRGPAARRIGGVRQLRGVRRCAWLGGCAAAHVAEHRILPGSTGRAVDMTRLPGLGSVREPRCRRLRLASRRGKGATPRVAATRLVWGCGSVGLGVH